TRSGIRFAAVFGEPGVDRGWLVAAVAAEPQVRDAALTCGFADPRLGDGQEFGDLFGGEQAVAQAASCSSWLPQALQPGRGLPRANSSSLVASGYMRSSS